MFKRLGRLLLIKQSSIVSNREKTGKDLLEKSKYLSFEQLQKVVDKDQPLKDGQTK